MSRPQRLRVIQTTQQIPQPRRDTRPGSCQRGGDKYLSKFTLLKYFPCRQDSALSNASLNTSLSSDSGVWTEGQSPYRKYVEKLLKTKGIRKTLQLQHKETKYILHRAKVALEKSTPIMDTDYLSTSGHHDWQGQLVEERLNSSLPQHIQNDEEILKEFGCSHPFFRKMNLPSFRAVYLFLCRVPKVFHSILKINKI